MVQIIMYSITLGQSANDQIGVEMWPITSQKIVCEVSSQRNKLKVVYENIVSLR